MLEESQRFGEVALVFGACGGPLCLEYGVLAGCGVHSEWWWCQGDVAAGEGFPEVSDQVGAWIGSGGLVQGPLEVGRVVGDDAADPVVDGWWRVEESVELVFEAGYLFGPFSCCEVLYVCSGLVLELAG
ncbi:hypothetical protein [Arthrobacter sp. 179]|uniref:hypothetical protein n=1 Tax=Arthrobacter sp. 179 TaxID=3457734 RepID=UPI004034E557